MALGIVTPSGTKTPDKGLRRKTTPRVLVSKFGDGYEQRIANGINTLEEEYNVVYKTRPLAEISVVAQFLEDTKGVSNFQFNVPNDSGGETAIKAVCPTFSTSYDYDQYYTLTATIKRVYEP